MRPVANSELTEEMQRIAQECLALDEPVGTEYFLDDLLARVEWHGYYGADPKKPAKRHRGVTLYWRESDNVVTLPEVTIYGNAPAYKDRTILAVPRIETTTHEFRIALCEMCDRLGAEVDAMAAVMSFESGFNPAACNRHSGATGLIQFMPKGSAKDLGTTCDALAKMSAVQQLPYVERYFAPYKNSLKTLEGCYLSVFYPVARSMQPKQVIARIGSRVYDQNAGFDKDRDGDVEVEEICATVRAHAAKAGGRRVPV
jgi:hypothetical protein